MRFKYSFNFCVIFLFLTLLFTSCAFILGLNKPVNVNQENIEGLSKTYGIEKSYVCDTLKYNYFVYGLLKDSILQQRHYQPLQAIYFDKKGVQQAFFVNCNVGFNGFNLKWNKKGVLNKFPPHYTSYNDTVGLSTILRAAGIYKIVPIDTSKNTVVIFWNNFMGRQTKVFLNSFRKNINRSIESVNVVYINNDNLFLEL